MPRGAQNEKISGLSYSLDSYSRMNVAWTKPLPLLLKLRGKCLVPLVILVITYNLKFLRYLSSIYRPHPVLLAASQFNNLKLPPPRAASGTEPTILSCDIQASIQLFSVTCHVQSSQASLIWTAPPTLCSISSHCIWNPQSRVSN